MSIKVTDRRMFNEDGELREDYSYLDDEDAEGSDAATVETPASKPPPASAPSAQTPNPSVTSPGPSPGAPAEPTPEMPRGGAGRGPQFLDLVAYLAEPIALLLGDARLPDGESAEDLEQARALIDLVELLQIKTRGNLEEQEEAILEDLLYRLKMRYVEKRRG